MCIKPECRKHPCDFWNFTTRLEFSLSKLRHAVHHSGRIFKKNRVLKRQWLAKAGIDLREKSKHSVSYRNILVFIVLPFPTSTGKWTMQRARPWKFPFRRI